MSNISRRRLASAVVVESLEQRQLLSVYQPVLPASMPIVSPLDVTAHPASPHPAVPATVAYVQCFPAEDAYEGGQDGQFVLTRDSGDGTLVVSYTMEGTATNGVDYQAMTGTATFDPGVTAIYPLIKAIDDPFAEGTESVKLTVQPVSGVYTVGFNAAGINVIDNDNGAPTPPTVDIFSVDSAAESGPTPGAFTVTRSTPTGPLDVILDYSGAASSADYAALPPSVHFDDGDSSKSFAVTPVDDAQKEWTEDIVATIVQNPSYINGASFQATCGIVDNDPVDLTFSGVSESQENNPGIFMAVGGPRRAVSLSGPAAKAGASVSLSVSSEFRVWDSPSGGALLASGTTPATWTNAAIPGTVYLEAISASTAVGTGSITLSATDIGNRPSNSQDTAEATAIALNSLSLEDVTNNTNKATATTATPTDWFVPQDSSGGAKVQIRVAGAPATPDAGAHVLFKITGSTVTAPAGGAYAGNFGGNDPIRTFTPANDASRLFTVEAGVDANSDSVLSTDEVSRTINARVFRADLNARTIANNAGSGTLAEADEENPGAFLPINNDDDDYDAGNTADMSETGAIPGEDDLLPIVLPSIGPASTSNVYTLTIPSNVRVWQNPDRTGAVTSTTSIVMETGADKTLYVEGISKAVGTIQLNYTNGTATYSDLDRIKLTVFNWLGPLNVPGDAKYEYSAQGLPLGVGEWITPVGGAIASTATPRDATILWNNNPAVGRAVFQADTDYVWDLEVNVVQIQISAANNSATYPGTIHQWPTNGQLWDSHKVVAPVDDAMKANFEVAQIKGPTVNGSDRGVKFMEMGQVHQARFTRWRAYYDDLPAMKRVSKLEGYMSGTWLWDSGTAATVPWTFTNADHYLKPANDTALANQSFSTTDAPRLLITDIVVSNGDTIDRSECEMEHQVFFAVRTTQDINGSGEVLTQRLVLKWKIIAPGTWNATTGVWTFTGAGSGISGDGTWTEVTNGATVPKPATKTTLNQLLMDPMVGGGNWDQSLQ
jgi:hypothetical protein